MEERALVQCLSYQTKFVLFQFYFTCKNILYTLHKSWNNGIRTFPIVGQKGDEYLIPSLVSRLVRLHQARYPHQVRPYWGGCQQGQIQMLPTALAWPVKQSVASVRPSVCFNSYLLNRLTFRTRALVCIWVINISYPETESQGHRSRPRISVRASR